MLNNFSYNFPLYTTQPLNLYKEYLEKLVEDMGGSLSKKIAKLQLELNETKENLELANQKLEKIQKRFLGNE
jgi:hypothetical protein